MNILTKLGIAVALGVDAFSVSIVAGSTVEHGRLRALFRCAFHFGLFQTLMTLLGWALMSTILGAFIKFNNLIACGLLVLVSVKMFYSSFARKRETKRAVDITRGLDMVMLSIATSIDALAVGMGLGAIKIDIVSISLIIGFVAALMSSIGFMIGKAAKTIVGDYAEVVGAIILFFIAIKLFLTR